MLVEVLLSTETLPVRLQSAASQTLHKLVDSFNLQYYWFQSYARPGPGDFGQNLTGSNLTPNSKASDVN